MSAPCPAWTTLFLAVLAASALLLAPIAATAATGPSGPVTILAFGDSLTAGFGLTASQAVPARLEARLKADGLDAAVINAGVSGDTSASALSRLAWALTETPDMAIVELGANDGLRGMDVDRMEANLDAILRQLADRRVPILLAGMRMSPNLGKEYVARFDAVFPRLAAKYHTEFYPFYLEGVAGRPELNLPDGIHPNARGAEIIANGIYPLVKRMAEQAARDKRG